MKAAFFCDNRERFPLVYGKGRKEQVEKLFSTYGTVITSENLPREIDALRDIDCIFSTWGMLPLSDETLDKMPRLKAVFYAAGSVKYFAEPFLRRGIQVVTAAEANGEFVADYAASQIQLAAKGFFHNLRVDGYNARLTHPDLRYTGLYDIRVGIIGAGLIGRRVMEKMKLPGIEICVYDPYLSPEEAERLGVKKCTLEEMFSTCQVVSNHAPNIPETEHMIRGEHFESMLPFAAFINTGRGLTVDEEAMLAVLARRKDVVALLDVTYPEPPAEDSLLLHLPNVFHTSHIAGSKGNEVVSMADLCLIEARRFLNGEPMQHTVSLEKLKIMA